RCSGKLSTEAHRSCHSFLSPTGTGRAGALPPFALCAACRTATFAKNEYGTCYRRIQCCSTNRMEPSMDKAKDLFTSIRTADLSAVRGLLDADPPLASSKNEQGQSAVLASVYNNRPEIRDLLMARGAILELHEAAAAGQLERVKHLVDRDADLSRSYSPDGFP